MFLIIRKYTNYLWIGDASGVDWCWVVFFTACKINLYVFNYSYQRLFKIK